MLSFRQVLKKRLTCERIMILFVTKSANIAVNITSKHLDNTVHSVYNILVRKHSSVGQSTCLTCKGSLVRAQLFPPTKTSSEKGEVFVYPSRRLGIFAIHRADAMNDAIYRKRYASPHEVWWISSARWAVYHHVSACIFSDLM